MILRLRLLAAVVVGSAGCAAATGSAPDATADGGLADALPDVTSTDGSGDDGARPALPERDGTRFLGDCEPAVVGRCGSASERGRWSFRFECLQTSVWRVTVDSPSAPVALSVEDIGGRPYGSDDSGSTNPSLMFTSVGSAGACLVVVEIDVDAEFSVAITEVEPALTDVECDELCLLDAASGTDRGCDCDRTCRNACSPDTECDLPCNRDVPDYDCPFLEDTILADEDCQSWPSDTGAFEHRGACYRCGDGQQCCYTDGHDNGTGSYDVCPPIDPGVNDPDPHGCSGPLEHCACDVIPLCGCMAQSGNLELCANCVGESRFDLTSCNAPGTDATFCERAMEAAAGGFDWCGLVGDAERCTEIPPGF